MKRILSIILAAFLIFSALLAFSSCGAKAPEAVKIASIDGKTPTQAYEDAMALIDVNSSYKVSVDAEAIVKLAFIKIPVESEDMYVYSYVGGNSHHLLTDSGEAFINNGILNSLIGSSLSSKFDKETWYVDGAYYCIGLDGSRTVELTDKSPARENFIENAVDSVIEKHLEKAECYAAGDDKYIEILLEGEDMKLGFFTKEYYRVYFDDDGSIDDVRLIGEADMFVLNLELDYSYEVEPITAPANIDSFTVVE